MNVSADVRQRFLRDYSHIRHAEGRGSDASEYYRALPFEDLSGRNPAMWAMRAQTYRSFVTNVLLPIEQNGKPLDVLDLGAGNCWMSHQLQLRGHRPFAVDIFRDQEDGLAAARHYPVSLPAVEADFDQLPFPDQRFDLAIFNASLHYSTNYLQTLMGVRRSLRSSGSLVILDSPVYRRPEHGARMVAEKHADFAKRYGFASDALPSLEYLDVPMLKHLGRAVGITWKIIKPWYGWHWHLRPAQAFLRRRRPPSRFWILLGVFS